MTKQAADEASRTSSDLRAGATEQDDMNGHDDSENCWCGPTIEEYENGKLIIHQRTDN